MSLRVKLKPQRGLVLLRGDSSDHDYDDDICDSGDVIKN